MLHLVEFNEKEVQWKSILQIPNNLSMEKNIPAEMDNLGFYYTVMRNLTSGNDLIMKFHVLTTTSPPSYQIISNSTLMPLIDSMICVDSNNKLFIISNGNLINYNGVKSHVNWISPLQGILKTSQMLYDEDLLFVSFGGDNDRKGIARINIGNGQVIGYTESNQYLVELYPSMLSFDERYIVGFEKKSNSEFWMHIVDQKFIYKGSLSTDLMKDKNGKLIDLSKCSNVMSQVDSILFFCTTSNSSSSSTTNSNGKSNRQLLMSSNNILYKFDINEDSLRATLHYQVEFVTMNSCSKQIARFDHYSYFATVCDSHVFVFSMNSPQFVRKPLKINTNENTQIVGSAQTFFVVTPNPNNVQIEVIHAV